MGTRAGVLVGLLAATAFADPTPSEIARDRYTQGTKFFALTHYDEAIVEFEAAFQAKPDPVFLYNIAQAHRLAGHLEKSVRFYRNFLSAAPDSPQAGEIERRIADMEKAIEAQRQQTTSPPISTNAPSSTTIAPPAIVEPPRATTTKRAPKWPVAVGVVAGVVLVGGAVTVGAVVGTRPHETVVEWSAR